MVLDFVFGYGLILGFVLDAVSVLNWILVLCFGFVLVLGLVLVGLFFI
jgi:hypothetical protein